ncbi:hypothetical protein, partial [Variovorax sp. efr-133-TYG-130]|uniref:hypothetical protein n=1 Tax=Variovorax sp. efr-133-TYG-130 TaxID=3040327 RepID=UPI002553DC0D
MDLLDAKPHPDHLAALLLLSKNGWSTQAAYYDEENLPIAQAAVKALGKLGALDAATADELYSLAIDTRDSDLRYAIFVLLVNQAEGSSQEGRIQPVDATHSLNISAGV